MREKQNLRIGTFHFNNIEFDAAGLRKEEYNDQSRTPNVIKHKNVTLKDDSLRRDFTVNAIYCNIVDKQITDLVGGITDLQRGIIRTCNNNTFKTFKDDPLRLLRAIRQCITKFGFKFDKEILDAFSNKNLRTRLATMTARERMAAEMQKMLKGDNIFTAIKCIVDFDIASILFDTQSNNFQPRFYLG